MKSFVRQSLTAVILQILAFCAISIVSAQEQNPASTAQGGGNWKTMLGGGMLVKPKYQGSSDYDVWPIPYFEFEYKRSFFISPYRGIGYKSEISNGLKYQIGLGFDFGRDEEDGDLLKGMGDIDFSGIVRLGAEYDLGPISAGLSVNKAVTGAHDGYEIEATLGHQWVLREWNSMLRLGLNFTWSSSEYLQTYFGVTSAQSLTSGHTIYLPDAGLKEIGGSAMLMRRLNQRWSLMVLANYGKFVGDVADSPLVESDHRLFGGMFVVRSF